MKRTLFRCICQYLKRNILLIKISLIFDQLSSHNENYTRTCVFLLDDLIVESKNITLTSDLDLMFKTAFMGHISSLFSPFDECQNEHMICPLLLVLLASSVGRATDYSFRIKTSNFMDMLVIDVPIHGPEGWE